MFPAPEQLLPHRRPLLQIDAILGWQPGISLQATKLVEDNHPFFEGHFPGYPILPGVVLIEMLYQAGGLFARMETWQATTAENRAPGIGKAIKITQAIFRQEVRPGMLLHIDVALKQRIHGFYVFNGTITSSDTMVATAEVTIQVVS